MDSASPPTDHPGTSGGVGKVGSYERAILEATVEKAFSAAAVSAVRAVPSEGPHLVASVHTADGGRFALKCAPTADGDGVLAREVGVMNYLRRRTDVPVPEVVDVDLDGTERSPPYFTSRWVEGATLREATRATTLSVQMELFRRLGGTLATLHRGTAFDAPGTAVPSGPGSLDVRPAPSWPELFAEELAEHVAALCGTRFEPLSEEVWDSLAGRLPRLDTGEAPALLHGDVGEGNVVYDGTTVEGLLDWERAFVGHPEYDLCRAEVRYFWNLWGEADTLQSSFYAGYRAVRPLGDGFDARRRIYLATFYLMSLRDFDEWGPQLSADLDAFAGRLSAKLRGLATP